MKEKILELIYIGSRKQTNDKKSYFRALKFIDLISEDEYVMHLRDDEPAALEDPKIGDIWTKLDLLCTYSSTKNPAITLGSEYMKKEGLLARIADTYQFVSTDGEKTSVFRNYNSLLVLNRNGASSSFRITLLRHYTTTGMEVESFQSLTQNEIAHKFFINLKKYK